MRRTSGLVSNALLLLLLAGAAQAGKPLVDYDSDFDFERCTTVGWGEGVTPAKSELDQRRIEVAVTSELRAAGLREAESPDLSVVTHVRVDQVSEPKARVGIGVGGGTGWGGIGVGTSAGVGTKTTEVTTLVIQLYDARSGELVWEAETTDALEGDPEKLERSINRAVQKAFKKYPPRK